MQITTPKTVAQVIAPITKAISQLGTLADMKDKESGQLYDQIQNLNSQREGAQMEAAKARRLQARLEALLKD